MMKPLKNAGLCLDQIRHCNVSFGFECNGVTLHSFKSALSRVTSLVTERLITSLLMQCLGVICPAGSSLFVWKLCLHKASPDLPRPCVMPVCTCIVFMYCLGRMSCLSQLDLIIGWIRMKGRWEWGLQCDVTGGQIQYLIKHYTCLKIGQKSCPECPDIPRQPVSKSI